jgi:ribosomal protein S14
VTYGTYSCDHSASCGRPVVYAREVEIAGDVRTVRLCRIHGRDLGPEHRLGGHGRDVATDGGEHPTGACPLCGRTDVELAFGLCRQCEHDVADAVDTDAVDGLDEVVSVVRKSDHQIAVRLLADVDAGGENA